MAGIEPPKPRDLKRPFQDVLKHAADMVHSHERIDALRYEDDDGSGHRHRQIEQLAASTRRTMATEKALIEEALARLDEIIAARRAQSAAGYQLPTVEEIRERTRHFFEDKQPIIPAPYAPLCGSIPWPDDQFIPEGSYVCARNMEGADSDDDQYFLAYVIGFDPETSVYHVCDADPELTTLTDVEVPAHLVIPMPTSVPARRTKFSSHAPRTTVLALWQDDNETWTTVFYRATVVSCPTNSPGSYGLRFEGDYTASTPERYVVRSPTQEAA